MSWWWSWLWLEAHVYRKQQLPEHSDGLLGHANAMLNVNINNNNISCFHIKLLMFLANGVSIHQRSIQWSINRSIQGQSWWLLPSGAARKVWIEFTSGQKSVDGSKAPLLLSYYFLMDSFLTWKSERCFETWWWKVLHTLRSYDAGLCNPLHFGSSSAHFLFLNLHQHAAENSLQSF